MDGLLSLAAELVDIPSVSHHERAIADRIEAQLRAAAHLEVERIGDSVVARTSLGRRKRLLLAGHLDTVPPFGDDGLRLDGDTLWGLGAVDMKGGLAVLLDLAVSTPAPAVDVTYLFYACEEVDRSHNALGRLADERPELLQADAAVLGEPTGGWVEAGCQGTMRLAVRLGGRRAHTARPWMGRNAIHRLAPVLTALAEYEPRRVVLDGCEFTEQLQAVRVDGGFAGNVVPDSVLLEVNHRFAPDRSIAEAEAGVRAVLGAGLDPTWGDEVRVVDAAAGAPPALDHPLLAALVAASSHPPRAKVGWTDVATLWAVGVPAANYGPGDPALAHTPDEHVSEGELHTVRRALAGVLGSADR